MFHADTVYVIGDAKTATNNPITQQFSSFFIGLVIDKRTHLIVDAECSTTVALTTQFIRSLIIGKSILDTETLNTEIEQRYYGSSQKAIIVALKNAQIKYQQI